MKLIRNRVTKQAATGASRLSGRRLGMLLGLLVLVPAILVGVLGWVVAGTQRERAIEQYRSLLRLRVDEAAEAIVGVVSAAELDASALRSVADEPLAQVRARLRSHRLVRAAFITDASGRQVYPPNDGTILSQAELAFLERFEPLREEGGCFETDAENGEQPESGWCTWYWGDGVNALYWMRLADGRIVALDVIPAALVSDLISVLPASIAASSYGRGRSAASQVGVRLVDERGSVVYQWGGFRPEAGQVPLVEERLSEPLSAWRLECYAAMGGVVGAGRPAHLLAVAGALAVGVALAAVAALVYSENRRAAREALRRVSFVNQVSHELKTPLTNIRMYTELLEQRLAGGDEKTLRHVQIVSDESRRLGRLIGNVLSFARGQRGTLKLRLRRGVPDELVARVLEHFAPAFAQREMRVAFNGGANAPVVFDQEVLEQILNNLLSNAEKYAGQGCVVSVDTTCDGVSLRLRVSDNGPGIPHTATQQVFEPFERLDDRLTEGVSGTGIGLAIVRQLAELHGGSVVVAESVEGAVFEVTLALDADGRADPGVT